MLYTAIHCFTLLYIALHCFTLLNTTLHCLENAKHCYILLFMAMNYIYKFSAVYLNTAQNCLTVLSIATFKLGVIQGLLLNPDLPFRSTWHGWFSDHISGCSLCTIHRWWTMNCRCWTNNCVCLTSPNPSHNKDSQIRASMGSKCSFFVLLSQKLWRSVILTKKKYNFWWPTFDSLVHHSLSRLRWTTERALWRAVFTAQTCSEV